MNNITELTKRDIYELLKNGYAEQVSFSNYERRITYCYYGRLEEIDFLRKLYPLAKMPGKYDTYENAEQDIIKHTIANDDYEFCWVFTDDRFELMHGPDEKILDFLCAIFHPENRVENGSWHPFLERINSLLKHDGYELYEESKISGRTVFSYRNLSSAEIASNKFIPYSIRNKYTADNSLSISKTIRKEIYNLFFHHNELQYRKTETNWSYDISSIDALIEDINEYYIPQAFDAKGKYTKADNLEQFIMNNYPYCVFDAIELFAQYNYDAFPDEINLIFQNYGFPFRLAGRKIESTKLIIKKNVEIEEPGLKELFNQAFSLYRSSKIPDKQTAVEKLWDAFERLKTYYEPEDKKSSVSKIIEKISNNNPNYKKLLNDEFAELTTIGNNYRIRHHEMNKINIVDSNYYDYFFQRCFALIDLALKYLN